MDEKKRKFRKKVSYDSEEEGEEFESRGVVTKISSSSNAIDG
eukprot:CAMPEP_0194594682 /NCGR_PEP_ID=MMETSP0292-20121207/24422_1 /TAXON_ID=39354 /ORGANISM="Heterosigma akashiwo, Strain CCMP2393" /LENGTH=41 /DNA_ID= /DNA_START= /DNA_END= /DNA_ORIENTATION=